LLWRRWAALPIAASGRETFLSALRRSPRAPRGRWCPGLRRARAAPPHVAAAGASAPGFCPSDSPGAGWSLHHKVHRCAGWSLHDKADSALLRNSCCASGPI